MGKYYVFWFDMREGRETSRKDLQIKYKQAPVTYAALLISFFFQCVFQTLETLRTVFLRRFLVCQDVPCKIVGIRHLPGRIGR